MTARQWHWRTLSAAWFLVLTAGVLAAQPAESPFKGGKLDAETPNYRDVNQWTLLVRQLNEIADTNLNNPTAAKAAVKAELTRNKELLDKVLRWYIYRLTWEELHEGRVPEEETRNNRVAPTMHEHMLELFGDRSANNSRRILPATPAPLPAPWVTTPAPASLTPALQLAQELHYALLEEIRPTCLKYLKEVLANRNLIARINAVRVLDHFAAFGQDAVAPELLAILENPQESDAVKYWAILGLGRLFEIAQNPGYRKTFQGDNGLLLTQKCSMAILDWLEKHTKLDPKQLALLPQEDRLAISFMRRAAIQALAETRRPLVIDGARLGQLKPTDGPIAELLLRIVANKENTVLPEPTWTERVIAARAVCMLDPKLSPSYHPDYAAYVLAQFISEMANTTRSTDAAVLSLYASELKGGVDMLTAALPRDGAAVEYIQNTLLPAVNPVLAHIYDRGQNRTAPQELLRTLERSKPAAQQVYKPQR